MLEVLPNNLVTYFWLFKQKKWKIKKKLNTVYDDVKISSAQVLLNNDRYPLNSFEIDFAKNYFDVAYTNFISFKKIFYGVDPILSTTPVGLMEYKKLYPILFFDVSKQSERLKSGITDITLQARFTATVPAKTVAHVVMVSDRKLKFQSVSEKMSVIF